MVAAPLADLERILANGTHAERWHILQRIVKQVRVHEREPIEIWYAVPNVERPGDDAPGLEDAVHGQLRLPPHPQL